MDVYVFRWTYGFETVNGTNCFISAEVSVVCCKAKQISLADALLWTAQLSRQIFGNVCPFKRLGEMEVKAPRSYEGIWTHRTAEDGVSRNFKIQASCEINA